MGAEKNSIVISEGEKSYTLLPADRKVFFFLKPLFLSILPFNLIHFFKKKKNKDKRPLVR